MPAVELMNRRILIADNAFALIRILQVDPAILGSHHLYKYSLAYIVDGVCVLLYDNERARVITSILVNMNTLSPSPVLRV